MADIPCKIVLGDRKKESCSVADLVKQKVQQNEPLLVWADPDPLRVNLSNTTGRRSGFEPLVRGKPSWPDDVSLVEARLFWDKAALHVVAEEDGGCAWVRLEETADGNDALAVARRELPVLTVRDRSRFGLVNDQVIEGLRAVEYRRQGRLVAWRLVIGGQ